MPLGFPLTATAKPLAWHWHPIAWFALASLATAYGALAAATRSSPRRFGRPVISGRNIAMFALGWILLASSLTWPLDDLARQWSFLARMSQQIVLSLAVPPLLLASLPRWLYARASAHHVADATLRALTHPVTATVIFSCTTFASFLPSVVRTEAGSHLAHAGVSVGLVAAGAVMWTPVLRLLPGARQLSTGGRIAYLFIQSILPNFPALIFIFARHPFYAVYASHATSLGISALADQQLAGATAKVAGITILWGTAAAIWLRSERAQRAGMDPDPLTWDDVERELRRAERRPRRRSNTG